MRSLFSRSVCPVKPKAPRLSLRHWMPLIGFVVPTIVVGYGVVIPRSCIAGVNELSVGFATTILGAVITYAVGLRNALRDAQSDKPRA